MPSWRGRAVPSGQYLWYCQGKGLSGSRGKGWSCVLLPGLALSIPGFVLVPVAVVCLGSPSKQGEEAGQSLACCKGLEGLTLGSRLTRVLVLQAAGYGRA